jgi:secretion/DNA translocation related TadE-like protein
MRESLRLVWRRSFALLRLIRRLISERLACESGAGSLLAVGVVASMLAVTSMVIMVSLALAVKQRVTGAADAAALAAADTASGAVAGFPCDVAAAAARLNGAELRRCEVSGAVATVSARAGYLGFDISVAARAGPPGEGGG